ncbi:probable tubulin polyglutamylase ttll-15 [Amphiura filiformis]|uniref:probable tubulin polyglutamylase ttll-15 n=1 Tax=Amphiura filiformis TaxID=82378 RepID=UPI003B210554
MANVVLWWNVVCNLQNDDTQMGTTCHSDVSGVTHHVDAMGNISAVVPRLPSLNLFYHLRNHAEVASFQTVQRVFSARGYQRTEDMNSTSILWTHTYPYQVDPQSRPLHEMVLAMNPEQTINHFPGMEPIFNKHIFSTSMKSKYIPKTFLLPNQKREFLQEMNNTGETRLWMKKNFNHRGNVLKEAKDHDLNQKSLIQQFIGNQFTVAGHAIQIGVRVILTSVEPMRAYIFHDVSNRVANKPFYPINIADNQTYLTDGEFRDEVYLSLYSLPETKTYMKTHGYSRWVAVKTYARKQGLDASKVMPQLLEAVRGVLLNLRPRLVRQYKQYFKDRAQRERSNLLEFSRWDFIVDEDLNAYLLEANLSPELHTRNPMSNIAIARALYNLMELTRQSNDARVRDGNVNILRGVCYEQRCQHCKDKECQLCAQCLSSSDKTILKTTFAEHINRKGYLRTYPEPMTQEEASLPYHTSTDNDVNSWSKIDILNREWLRLKCIHDYYWCN